LLLCCCLFKKKKWWTGWLDPMISPGFRLFEFFFIVGGAKPLLSTCRRLVHLWPVIGFT
jgi:hypothetical protein